MDERDPARIPVEEAGGGVAEGFEAAEEMLRDNAEHREPGGNPKYDAPPPEPDASDAVHGEADHAESQDDVENAEQNSEDA